MTMKEEIKFFLNSPVTALAITQMSLWFLVMFLNAIGILHWSTVVIIFFPIWFILLCAILLPIIAYALSFVLIVFIIVFEAIRREINNFRRIRGKR